MAGGVTTSRLFRTNPRWLDNLTGAAIPSRPAGISNAVLLLLALAFWSCRGQGGRDASADHPTPQKQGAQEERVVGGPCEGCEALLEYGSRTLNAVDTLPKFKETEPKLRLTGTVFQADGKTPAEGVILYFYQTNREGIYETRGDETGWARHHGFIRGWVRTGPDGKYTIYTFRPGAYPSRSEPEHIHLTVKEPNTIPYYLDSYHFQDDPLLTGTHRKAMDNRGGSGIVAPRPEDGMLTAYRDLFLGLHIPGY